MARSRHKSILIATAALGDLLGVLRERAVQPVRFNNDGENGQPKSAAT